MHSMTLTWNEIADRLAPARSYWLGTTNSDGSPHAAPVWGVVVAKAFHRYSERSTVKARNVATDPRVVIHLESAEQVEIVNGRLNDLGHPRDSPEVVEALDVKYSRPEDQQYLPSLDGSFDVLYVLRPEKALTWSLSDYESTQSRWLAEQRE